MLSVPQAVEALVESGTDTTLDPADLCLQLVHQLQNATSLREVLSLTAPQMAAFCERVSQLLQDRVDLDRLLPMTQDDAANTAAMNLPAWTLTENSLAAAEVYANILATPGALPAGWVRLEGLQGIKVLLERLKVEVCGREQQLKSGAGAQSISEAVDSDDDDEEDVRQPIKRSRQGDSVGRPEAYTKDNSTTSASNAQDLVRGLQVAVAVCKIPVTREFESWSTEARQVIIAAVAIALALCSATKNTRSASSTVTDLSQQGMEAGRVALVHCVFHAAAGGSEDNSLTRRHETTVSVLRGLFPALTFKETLPNGESGKMAAATNAAAVLEKLVQAVAKDTATATLRSNTRSGSSMTPSPMSPSLVAPSTPAPKTPGSARRTPSTKTPKLKGFLTPTTPSTRTTTVNRPRPILTAVVGALQKLAAGKGLERAAIRNFTVDTLHSCIARLPTAERSQFLTFLIQLCHSKVAVHRLVGCELIGKFLTATWLYTDHTGEPALRQARTPSSVRKSLSPLVTTSSENMPTALFGALQGRLMDRVPTVRAASASTLASVLTRVAEDDDSSLLRRGFQDALQNEAEDLVDVLAARCVDDDKATVRRAAIQGLTSLLALSSLDPSMAIPVYEQLCRDVSVQTRKAAAEGLTQLLQYAIPTSTSSGVMEKAWTSSVLAMVLDSEMTCANKAVEWVETVLLAPILSEQESRAASASWRMLATLGGEAAGAARSDLKALRVALKGIAQSRNILSSLLGVIHQVAIDTLGDSPAPDLDARRTGAWCLFAALIDHAKDANEIAKVMRRKKLDLDFLATTWDQMRKLKSRHLGVTVDANLDRCMRYNLQILAKLAPCVDKTLAEQSAEQLNSLLASFELAPELIGYAASALCALFFVVYPDDARQRCASWIKVTYDECEKRIANSIDLPEDGLVRALFTTGELSMVGFAGAEDDSTVLAEERDDSKLDFLSALRGLHEHPRSQLTDLVQAFLGTDLPGAVDQATPPAVRAHAFVALGKLCLRDESLAKRSLNILARELHENMSGGNSTVQSNVLLVLGDLCIKYTNLVDRHLPVMAACLQAGVTDMSSNVLATTKNGSAIVRKHAILLLSSLLLQDYIKWRGLLFHRFLLATADEDDEVAELAETVLCGPLLARSPKLFPNNFVESLFVLNRCTAHPIYVAAASAGDGGSGISVGFEGIFLSGQAGRVRRKHMYELMLSRMSDEDKISVTARLTKEVLGSALESGTDLHRACLVPADDTMAQSKLESAFEVLSDALTVLSSPSIRVGKSLRDDDQDIEDPTVSNTSRRVVVARGRLLSKLSHKHLIEIILPILCNLKAVLQQSTSRLLKPLVGYLVDVYRLYKAQVREFLAADPGLLQEIEFDARQVKKDRLSHASSNRSFASIQSHDE